MWKIALLLLFSIPAFAATPRHPISPVGNPQVVVASSGATLSSAVGATSHAVRLVSDIAVFVATGANPTAVSTGASFYLPAATPQVIPVNPSDKVSVINVNGQAGTNHLWITEALSLVW